jgi:peroxiredoxin
LLLAPVVLLAAFFAVAFWGAAADGLEHKWRADLASVAPDYEERDPAKARQIENFSLKDRAGASVSLSQFAAADIIVVNIWSSTCPSCKKEVPSLVELDRRLPRVGKAVLLTIATDEGWDDVQSFFPQGTDLRILFDPQAQVTKGLFGTEKFPETFVLDKQRRVRARFDGPRDWHSQEMLDYLRTFAPKI